MGKIATFQPDDWMRKAPTDAEWKEPLWDDELDRLTRGALVLSSEDAVGSAVARAVNQLVARNRFRSAQSSSVHVLAAADFKGVMKAALRRLTKRQMKNGA